MTMTAKATTIVKELGDQIVEAAKAEAAELAAGGRLSARQQLVLEYATTGLLEVQLREFDPLDESDASALEAEKASYVALVVGTGAVKAEEVKRRVFEAARRIFAQIVVFGVAALGGPVAATAAGAATTAVGDLVTAPGGLTPLPA